MMIGERAGDSMNGVAGPFAFPSATPMTMMLRYC